MLRNSVPYNGRGACMRCRWCVGFACEMDAKCGTHNTVIPKAINTGNCEVRCECIVREILTSDRGRATGVVYYDSNGRLQEQSADVVVVSCAAIESARLLLNCKSRLFPNGLGNRYDWVGRNLQGQPTPARSACSTMKPTMTSGPELPSQSAILTMGIQDSSAAGCWPTSSFVCRTSSPPARRQESLAGERAIRISCGATTGAAFPFMGPMQEMPVFDSRVQVDPKVKDHWGIPVARLSGHRHQNDQLGANFMSAKAEAWLKEAGAATVIRSGPISLDGPSGGQHQAGTCRMGNDPKTSVVDKYCRVHDVDNLYVIDGSVHPNNGGFNPVLTIMAMAYYASANLVKTRKGMGAT